MQIKMRKVLALLSVLAMLCTMLPLGSMVSAATVVVSYDFEDGTSSWGGTVIDDNGGKAIQWDANGYGYLNKKPTLQNNTWYKVTFDHKGDSVNGLIWNDSVALAIMQTPASADWTTYSYIFYSGEHASRHFRFQNPSGSAKTIYLDNIKLETLDGTAQYDGYLYDGNFEANAGNWVKLQSGIGVAADPTGAGQGNVMVTNSTAQGDMFRQRFYLDAQTDYVLSFKVYGYASSSELTNSVFYTKFNSKITYDLSSIEHDGLAGVAQASTYNVRCNVNTNTGKWINVSIPFSSNEATATDITIYNYRTIGKFYFDDFKVTKAGEEPSEPETPAVDNLIVNGDFNAGNINGWNSGSSSEKVSAVAGAAYSGSYGALVPSRGTTFTAYQDVTVEANTDYTVSFWYKSILTSGSSIRPMYFGVYGTDASNTTATLISEQPELPYSQTEWTQVTVTFNSGDYTTVRLGYGCKSSSGQDNYLYVDEIVMTKDSGDEPETPVTPPVGGDASFDGYITNGDFETGTLAPWIVEHGGKVSTTAASGSYGLQGTATAKYSPFVSQTVTVEANTDYVITFKAKLAASGGQPRFYVTPDGNTDHKINDKYYFTDATTEWKTFQLTFNSGANTSLVLMPAQGVTGGGDIYYDDIKMEKAQSGYQGLYPETMTAGADIRMMTYNVLVGQDTANGGYDWGSAITGRPEKACAMINYYKPDVIALEEFSGEWYDYFVANMTNYAFTEMTSADSQNNGKLYTCLAYNTDTIELVSTDLKRMTKSHWGTQGMRYLNIATFKVKATGEQFIACATHPDAGDLTGTEDLNGDGVAAEGSGYWRQFQLEEVAGWLAELSTTYKMPVICGGDFNASGNETASYGHIVDAGYTDATAGRYIDHIFYNGMATHLYETTVADAAVAGASDHNAVFADIQFLDEYATSIKDAKDYIKTQGRNQLKDGALWLDFSASGIEFSANCEGKVSLNLNVKSLKQTDSYGGLYFTVIVDGVKKDRAQCHITSTGNVELVLAENLPAGNHTFEVYRQTEHRGAEVGISSIVMNGSFNEKPADNRLYIEFIGDSISTGFGALGTSSDSDGGSPKWQDATAAYPYLVAKALGADFSDVAYSGIGAKYGWQDPNMLNFYPYQRWQYDRTTQYNFNARQPDVVVIALGTNDISMETEKGVTLEQRLAGYQELLDMVRAKNPNSKIVWIYGMMTDEDNARIPAIIEENGGAAAGLYSLELVTNTAGAGWHPSAAGQQKFADDLVAFLNSDVLVKYVGNEMQDNDEGNVLSFVGNSRMEMTSDELGLAFGFQITANGITVNNGTEADLTNATVDAFGDGVQYKLVKMGAIMANNPNSGLVADKMTIENADGRTVLDVNAQYLYYLKDDTAKFAIRITNIPLANEATIIYARAYYVFEYVDADSSTREVVVYDDIQSANYIDKYDSNDGVLEW